MEPFSVNTLHFKYNDDVFGCLTEMDLLVLQYFIGVTVLAMVPELPEIVNGILFALQNNISLRFEYTVMLYYHFA